MNKKGFTTQQPCHPEFISGSCSKIADQARNDKKIKGFTLIELLVVVLIIAVLAMIALPKYKLTVENARATEAYTLLKAITDAAERYRLATGGSLPGVNAWSQLDIEVPNGTTDGSNAIGDTWQYLLSGSGGRALAYRRNPSSTYWIERYYPGNGNSSAGKYRCTVYLSHADADFYTKVCTHFCGVAPTGGGSYSSCYKT